VNAFGIFQPFVSFLFPSLFDSVKTGEKYHHVRGVLVNLRELKLTLPDNLSNSLLEKERKKKITFLSPVRPTPSLESAIPP